MTNILTTLFCGLFFMSLNPLLADSNISEFNYDKTQSKDYEETALKIIDAVVKKSDIYADDLTHIVGIAKEEDGKIKNSFPTSLSKDCKTQSCRFTGKGSAIKVKTSNTTGNPEFEGISLGFQNEIKGIMRTESTASATVCNLEGVYLSKLFIRKNVKAFKIDKLDHGVKVTLWLQGAGSFPNCQEN